jgi:2,3-dihydroxybenzoate decarboxylase
MFACFRSILDNGTVDDPGFRSLWGFFLLDSGPRAADVRRRLLDLGDERLADMDASGIDRQIISLTSPGVQILDRETAVSIATDANDQLAEAVARHPDRFSALAAMAPQDPDAAVREIDRAVGKLGFHGVILNSHTHGDYFDDPKFWPILEAAEALDVPVYLHPNTPSRGMIEPLLELGLDGAIFGFGVETGMHLLRIIVSGVFDRFPRLKIVVGHLGEALPFWLFRMDFMHRSMVKAARYPAVKPLRKKISDYLRENVWITTSGMAWEPAILFVRSVIGADRVMYAMDYPYQFVPEEVAVTDNLPVSEADKKALYQGIAESVFRL